MKTAILIFIIALIAMGCGFLVAQLPIKTGSYILFGILFVLVLKPKLLG